jgi:hypothetical protein
MIQSQIYNYLIIPLKAIQIDIDMSFLFGPPPPTFKQLWDKYHDGVKADRASKDTSYP